MFAHYTILVETLPERKQKAHLLTQRGGDIDESPLRIPQMP